MLGEQIKRCREKRGFTQEQLAEKIGVSIETISSIERGIKMPRLQNFVAIANQLGVSADELLQDELDFGFIAEANALSKKLEELSRADHELSDCTGWRKIGIRVSFFSGKEKLHRTGETTEAGRS
mgnify:CR=1 FL=1